MPTFSIHGTYIYMVDADTKEEAINGLKTQADEIFYEFDISSVSE